MNISSQANHSRTLMSSGLTGQFATNGYRSTTGPALKKFRTSLPSGCGPTITTARTWPWEVSPQSSIWPRLHKRSTSRVSGIWGDYRRTDQRRAWVGHRSGKLKAPANIYLLYLPPYAPELNPIEHVWDELREKFFHNRVFSSLQALEEHLAAALKTMGKNWQTVRSIVSWPWIIGAFMVSLLI